MSLRHAAVLGGTNRTDVPVSKNVWNAPHEFSGGESGNILFRDPAASDGATFRALVASDIPALAYDAAGAAAAITPGTLGLVIGTHVQAYSASLVAIHAVVAARIAMRV